MQSASIPIPCSLSMIEHSDDRTTAICFTSLNQSSGRTVHRQADTSEGSLSFLLPRALLAGRRCGKGIAREISEIRP